MNGKWMNNDTVNNFVWDIFFNADEWEIGKWMNIMINIFFGIFWDGK
jgi:hypothetical protein